MTTATLTDTTPRIWAGCLACYNNRRLIGELVRRHRGRRHYSRLCTRRFAARSPGCEEIWVTDHKNLPFRGECSPRDTAQLARVVEEVHENDREAFLVWAISGDHIQDCDGLPERE